MLADSKDAASVVAHVVADNFDKLREDVRNELLLKLAICMLFMYMGDNRDNPISQSYLSDLLIQLFFPYAYVSNLFEDQ
jgi:hypothetical protein